MSTLLNSQYFTFNGILLSAERFNNPTGESYTKHMADMNYKSYKISISFYKAPFEPSL